MATFGPITLHLRADTSAALLSLRSVLDALAATSAPREALPEGFGILFGSEPGSRLADLVLDRPELFFAEPILRAADGALEVVLNPGDGYLKLVAAITSDGHVTRDADFHGWPILSLVPGRSSVTEAPGASSSGRKGQPGGQG